MASELPFIFRASPLPGNFKGTPQQFLDALVERLSAESEVEIAVFVTGSVEPSSNVGPWLKDGTTWYVWDDVTGAYIPQILAQGSLGYIIGSTEPDPDVYQFWIETAVGGSPLALKIFYSGSWVDVYATTLALYMTTAAFTAAIASYSTTAQMNTAIAAGDAATLAAAEAYTDAEIAGIPGVTIVAGQGIFKARPSVAQALVFGSGSTQNGIVTLGTEDFDPDACFGTNKFTAPANGYYQFNGALNAEVTAGSPTDVEISGQFSVNGSVADILNDEPDSDSTAGRTITGSTVFFLSAGDEVTLTYTVTLDAAGTVEISNGFTRLSGYRIR